MAVLMSPQRFSVFLLVAVISLGLPSARGQYSAIVSSQAAYHTCALTTSGGARCWGWNTNGELGNGSAGGMLFSPPTADILTNVSAIAVGSTHTCALMAWGGVRCWGYNIYGQLGNGFANSGANIVSPPADVLTNVSAIACGQFHTCALMTWGGVRCWGDNPNGQLGNGGTTQVNSPPTSDILTNVSAIVAGNAHTCALTTSGGVRCWGWNTNGQLGNGLTTTLKSPPTTNVLTNVSAIAAGSAHTCALMTWGGVRCWGANAAGQLGNGGITVVKSPPAVDVLTNVSAVAAGNIHTCALMTWGGVRCWGYGRTGQLGNGLVANILSPPTTDVLTGVSAITAGNEHTCALMGDGAFRCWGDNDYGQLGLGVLPIQSYYDYLLVPPSIDTSPSTSLSATVTSTYSSTPSFGTTLTPTASVTSTASPSLGFTVTSTSTSTVSSSATASVTPTPTPTLTPLCLAGTYCPGGVLSAAVPCPIGAYCPVNAFNYTACPPGTYNPNTNGASLSSCLNCAGGYFGNSSGLSSPTCTAVCPPGFYCPVGTAAPVPCGNASVYCPSGSSWPQSPGSGNYSTGGTNSSMYYTQAICPAGHYCTNGLQIGCPAGTFIASQGASTLSLCQQCPAGEYCGNASTAGTLCGGDDLYCPAGSSSPVPVDSGYYSTGTPGLRANESICPLGKFCVGGVAYSCPAGYYGASFGLNSSSCSGACTAGSYCPSGSTSATQLPCPAGSYCIAGLPISCPMGSYNPSVGGSSLSSCVNCTAGRYSAAVGANSSATCGQCPQYEGSNAGASVCWPGIIGVVAANPPPIIPGLSDGDTLTVYFTQVTSSPNVSNTAAIQQLFAFNPWLSTSMSGVWYTGGDSTYASAAQRLVITIAGSVNSNYSATAIGTASISLLSSGRLTNAAGTSQPASSTSNLITGTWGAFNQPAFVSTLGAIALPYGPLAGLDAGDGILLQFNEAVKQVNVNGKAAVDALMTFTPSNWAQNYSGIWINSSVLFVQALQVDSWNQSTFQQSVTLPQLVVNIMPSGGLTSQDGTSPAMSATISVASGSWGDVPCGVSTDVYSSTALQVSFSPPVTASGWSPTLYLVQWSTQASFPANQTSTLTTTALSVLLTGLTTDSAYYTRVAAVPASYPSVSLPAWLSFPLLWSSWPGCSCSLTAVYNCPSSSTPLPMQPQAPVISSISTVTGSLPTAGGANIVVTGSWLGINATVIRLVYMGGLDGQPTRVFRTSACTVLVPNTNISCVSVPGVGGNLSFQIIVDGVASAWSVDRLSHTTPSIVALYGQPTSTAGGALVQLSGLNFGPAALAPNVTAWCSPSSNADMQFFGVNCSVSQDNVGIECLTPPSVGSSLTWSVSIDGLTSQVPTYSTLPPTISSVSVVSPSVPTVGGGVLELVGTDLSVYSSVLSASVTYGAVSANTSLYDGSIPLPVTAAVTAAMSDCVVIVPSTVVHCTLPAGQGNITGVSLTVLDQTASFVVHGIAYDSPHVITSVPSPLVLTSDLSSSITLSGSGFGASPGVVGAWLVVNTTGLCVPVASSSLVVSPAALTYHSDSEISLQFPGWSNVSFSVGSVVIAVAGQHAIVPLSIAAPVVSALSLDSFPVGGVYTVDISGSSLGSLYSGACAASSASIDVSGINCTSMHVLQANSELQCVTSIASGTINVHTPAGVGSVAYSAASLTVSAVVTGVTPLVWSTSTTTAITVAGSRFGSPPPFGASVPLCLSMSVVNSNCTGAVSMCHLAGATSDGVTFIGTYLDNTVSCLLDASVGVGYSIRLNSQWIALPAGAGYAAPKVASAQLMTTRPNNSVLSVTGSGFGSAGCVGPVSTQCGVQLVLFDTSVMVSFDESSHLFVGGSNVTQVCLIDTWTDSAINCSVDLSSSGNIPMYTTVTVGGQSASLPLPFAPIVVSGVSSGQYPPTAGGTAFTVSGSGFGPPQSPIAVLVGGPSHPMLVTVSSHNDSVITAIAPEGSGAGVGVQVFGLLTSSTVLPILTYAAPVISGTIAPDGKPCEGNYPLVVFGQNLYWGAVVTIGGAECVSVVVDPSFQSLNCTAPSGFGKSMLTVNVSGLVTSAVFAFDPPSLTLVGPSPIDAMSSATIVQIHGSNFGLPQHPVPAVLIGPNICQSVLRVNTTFMQCTASSSVIGRMVVNVSLGGLYSEEALFVDRMCGEGHTGLLGQHCGPCPLGAVCPAFYPQPVAAPGYYPVSRDTFVGCVPPTACPGGNASAANPNITSLAVFFGSSASDVSPEENDTSWNTVNTELNLSSQLCSAGYTGPACNLCAPKYYRLDAACYRCPSGAVLLILLEVGAVVLLFGVAAYLKKHRVSTSVIGIGLDFMQILSIFTSLNFQWPASLKSLFEAASASTFNTQVLAPECTVSGWNFTVKWYVVQAVPGVIVCLLGAYVVIVRLSRKGYCQRFCCRQKSAIPSANPPSNGGGTQSMSRYYAMFGLIIQTLYFTYFMLVRGMLSAWMCSPSQNGVSSLIAEPSFSCDNPPAALVGIRRWAIASAVVYAVGIPFGFAWVLYRHRAEMREDQLLLSKGTGNSEESNPQYHVRRKYNQLYHSFAPDFTYWRLVLIVRKFVIVFVALSLTGSPMLQASLSIAIIFVSYAVQVKYRPFLDPYKRPAASSKSIAEYIVSKDAVVAYAMPYNRLETCYLMTSMFTLLSGMIFQSGYVSVSSKSYLLLTILVGTILVGSVVLFVGLLGVEVLRAVHFSRQSRAAARPGTVSGKPRMFSNPLARAIRRSVAGTSRREKVSQKPVLVRPEGQTIELRALAPVQPGEVKM